MRPDLKSLYFHSPSWHKSRQSHFLHADGLGRPVCPNIRPDANPPGANPADRAASRHAVSRPAIHMTSHTHGGHTELRCASMHSTSHWNTPTSLSANVTWKIVHLTLPNPMQEHDCSCPEAKAAWNRWSIGNFSNHILYEHTLSQTLLINITFSSR